MNEIKIVHFLNQFFAGSGGEKMAEEPLNFHDQEIGPGVLLNKILGANGKVVGTISCGDNYFFKNESSVYEKISEYIKKTAPDLLIAGPAFNAGRYGLACANLCKEVSKRGYCKVITGMFEENPGVDAGKGSVLIIQTGPSVGDMESALDNILRIGLKLVSGEKINSAQDEGYFPTGVRNNVQLDTPASPRAVDLLLKKIKGDSYVSELIVPVLDKVDPPEPISDLKTAVIAIASEGGMVPPDNPHKIPGSRTNKWGVYSFLGRNELEKDSFISIHGGFNTVFVNEDPDRIIPLDALRVFEGRGEIGKVYEDFLSTCGNGGAFGHMQEIGQAWAKELKKGGVTGVILPAT
ncbi:MAG: glycine/betaine/sarcosine/D-proline family reductase selenoprotein B [Nitrospinota bacterium]|nr:glycine/betaine/sarcosine/D-proline family reductase selenoprotein B [Nitrospinota bacterium]